MLFYWVDHVHRHACMRRAMAHAWLASCTDCRTPAPRPPTRSTAQHQACGVSSSLVHCSIDQHLPCLHTQSSRSTRISERSRCRRHRAYIAGKCMMISLLGCRGFGNDFAEHRFAVPFGLLEPRVCAHASVGLGGWERRRSQCTLAQH